MSSEATENEVVESITTNKNYPTREEPRSNSTDEDDLMKLFDQFSGFTLPMLD